MAEKSALNELLTDDIKETLRQEEEAELQQRESAERKNKAEKDFDFFCKTYLPHYFTSPFAEYQDILTDIESEGRLSKANCERLKPLIKSEYHKFFKPISKLKGIIDVEPREHGKTVRQSFAKVLWRVLFRKNRFVLLIGPSREAADENLLNIRTEIEENELILQDFGELKGPVWTNSKVELSNGTCIMAKGAGSSMRGVRFREHRPDLIVLDDILKDDAAESPTQRDKIDRWFRRVVIPLGRNAFFVFVNTIFHSDDIVCRLLKAIDNGSFSDWIGLQFSCYKPDGSPLWPEVWTLEALADRKKKMGSVAFSIEMESTIISDADRIIQLNWITYYKAGDNSPIIRTVQYVDPATGAHDLCGVVTIGVDAQGIIWELDSWGEACSETRLVETLIVKQKRFHPEAIGWERVAFQKIYKNYVLKLGMENGVYFPLHLWPPEGQSLGTKASRIRRLSILIENGIIRFRDKGAEELIDQLYMFPKHAYDDLPDALEGAVAIAESFSGSTPMAFKIGRPSKLSNEMRRFRHAH